MDVVNREEDSSSNFQAEEIGKGDESTQGHLRSRLYWYKTGGWSDKGQKSVGANRDGG